MPDPDEGKGDDNEEGEGVDVRSGSLASACSAHSRSNAAVVLQGATKIAAKRSGLKAGMGVAGAELTEDGDDVLR